jgi:hypothetical protein
MFPALAGVPNPAARRAGLQRIQSALAGVDGKTNNIIFIGTFQCSVRRRIDKTKGM